MHLTPHEQERLLIHVAADVAQKRRDRGLRLNYPEVMALLSVYVYEQARDGKTVSEIMDEGRRLFGRDDVMDGVPEMIKNVQVEATFPDGTKLVTIHYPIPEAAEEPGIHPGRIEHPAPPRTAAGPVECPGETSEHDDTADRYDAIFFNQDLQAGRTTIKVKNASDRPLQVGSHYHFAEVNPALKVIGPDGTASELWDCAEARGRRLNIAAGTSVRFEPGDECCVELVELQGEVGSSGDLARIQGLREGIVR
ncbi:MULTISPECIES: urease subunit gamma [unclassified Streptomyces]|uniref:urease subunit gamma n=1 Tax=unclassified Streptomyces TaxID=2593676 RepID=UPI002F909AA6